MGNIQPKDRELYVIRESEHFQIPVSSLHFCPFCRGYARIYGKWTLPDGTESEEAKGHLSGVLAIAQVICDNCGARGPRFDRTEELGSDNPAKEGIAKMSDSQFAAEAAVWWNRRIV